MPNQKMAPCCARTRARLTMCEADVSRLARIAAVRSQKGLSILQVKIKIEDAKRVVAQAVAAIIEHDANHAGGGL